MTAVPDPLEQHCPACSAAFRLADRRKRVQCPSCREIVDVVPRQPAAKPLAPRNSAKEVEDLKERVSRLEMLEARVGLLEKTIADLLKTPVSPVISPKRAPEPARVPPPEPLFPVLWREPLLNGKAPSFGQIAPEQRAALRSNLRALGTRCIIIQAPPADPQAAGMAEALRATFDEAGWTALPVAAAPERLWRHPLTLTTQPGSSPAEMATLFMALAAAGLTPISQIDPALDGRDPILSVGLQR